jgi:hypothetical protein
MNQSLSSLAKMALTKHASTAKIMHVYSLRSHLGMTSPQRRNSSTNSMSISLKNKYIVLTTILQKKPLRTSLLSDSGIQYSNEYGITKALAALSLAQPRASVLKDAPYSMNRQVRFGTLSKAIFCSCYRLLPWKSRFE